MAIHTETDRYKLETTRNGLFVVLTRKADGADVHMQGDAAGQAIEDADELSDCWTGDRFTEFFDYWASQYDDVMECRS
ncbi:MAG: hypothetical protein E6Q76_15735 [Rhizobium sp.]|nr:MAG: hypothetical protein E6Q76_15735 [Rhizobium sp.]